MTKKIQSGGLVWGERRMANLSKVSIVFLVIGVLFVSISYNNGYASSSSYKPRSVIMGDGFVLIAEGIATDWSTAGRTWAGRHSIGLLKLNDRTIIVTLSYPTGAGIYIDPTAVKLGEYYYLYAREGLTEGVNSYFYLSTVKLSK